MVINVDTNIQPLGFINAHYFPQIWTRFCFALLCCDHGYHMIVNHVFSCNQKALKNMSFRLSVGPSVCLSVSPFSPCFPIIVSSWHFLNIKTVFPGIVILILKIRRSSHPLIFKMGISILVKTAPSLYWNGAKNSCMSQPESKFVPNIVMMSVIQSCYHIEDAKIWPNFAGDIFKNYCMKVLYLASNFSQNVSKGCN